MRLPADANRRARKLLGRLQPSRDRDSRSLDRLIVRSAAVLDEDVLAAIGALSCAGSPLAALIETADAVVDAFDVTGRAGLLEVAAPRLSAALLHLDSTSPIYGETVRLLGNVCRARAARSGLRAQLAEAIGWAHEATRALPDDPRSWANAAEAWRLSFDFSGELDELEHALDLLAVALDRLDRDDERYAVYANDIGAMLFVYHDATGQTDLLLGAAEAGREAIAAAHDDDPRRSQYGANLCTTLALIGEHFADRNFLDEAIDAGVMACTPLDEARPRHLRVVQDAHDARFNVTNDDADLDAAVRLAQQAVRNSADDRQEHESGCVYASRAHRRRYEHTGDVDDLQACLDYACQGVSSATPASPKVLDALAIAYATRFERYRERDDLTRALTAARTAVGDRPAGAEPGCVLTLANILHSSHEYRRDDAQRDEAIELLTALTMDSADADASSVVWSSLGAFLTARFEELGRRDDLESALEALTRANEELGPADPNRGACLANLSNAHLSRFDIDGVPDDLDAGIDIAVDASQATTLSSVDRISVLANLTMALRTRYDAFGEVADVDACLAAGALALALLGPEDERRAAHLLALLAGARYSRYKNRGDDADLTWACAAARIAVSNTDPDDRALPTRLTTLAACQLGAFESSGDAASLDEAIDLGRRATTDTADTNAAAAVHTNLSNALLTRYELRRWLADVDAAVETSRRAVADTPDASPLRPGRLSNMGNALRACAAAHDDRSALDEAVVAGRQSIDHPDPRDPEIAAFWSNLALSYSDRFDVGGDAADLDAAVDALRTASDRTEPGHPSRTLYRANLAIALKQRYVDRGSQADITEAVSILSAAATTAPKSHPHTGAVWLALGNAYHSRYLVGENPADYAAAQQAWANATDSSVAAATRLIAAESLAVSARDEGDWPRAAAEFRRVIELVPVVAWHGLDRRGRERELTNLAPLARSACAAALAAGDTDAALENLEAGRSVLWKQMLDLRRDFRDLETRDQTLADRLRQLSWLLDTPEKSADSFDRPLN